MNYLISGDWQATLANLDKCKQALKVERKLITEYNPEAIFDLGDLKDAYNPVDTRVLSWQVGRLISDPRYHALLGNHDRVGQYDDKHNWFGLLKAAGVKEHDDPTIKVLGDTAFALLPYQHDKEELRRSAKWLRRNVKSRSVRRKVLLFHCSVASARYNAGGFIDESGITLDELGTSEYDFCFGGHIHRRQQLCQNAIYVGSPFAREWGEANQYCGFTVYNSADNSVRFIRSGIAGFYTFDWLKKHPNHKVPDGSKVKVTVKVSLKSNYYKKIEKRTRQVATLYPNVEVFPVPNFIETETHNDVVVELTSSDYEKVEKYVDATIPEHLKESHQQVLAYLAAKLTEVRGMGIRADGRIEFINICANNVLSFKNLKMSYRNRGIVLVKGDNLDWPGHSNGAGKTNLLSMPKVAFDGESLKGQKNDEWASEYADETSRVALKLKDDRGRILKIVRQRYPTKLQLFIDGKDESSGRRHKARGETQSIIFDLTGFSRETFVNAIYIDRKIANSFLGGTAKQRAELITRFQNIERFAAAKQLVQQDIICNKKAVDEINAEIHVEKGHIEQYDLTITEHKLTDRNKLKELKKELLKRIKVAKAKAKRKELLLPKLKKRIKRLHDVYEVREEKIVLLDQKIYALNVKSDEYASDIRTAQRAMRQTNCPVCKRPLKIEDKSDAIVFMRKEISRINLKKSQLFKERDDLKETNTSVYNKLQKYRSLLDECREASDESWAMVTEAKRKVREHKSESKNASIIAKAQAKKIKALERIDSLRSLIEHKHSDMDVLEYCGRAFSRDGLPMFINNLAVPILNKASEEYSKLFTNSEVQVRFSLDDGMFVPSVVNLHGSKTLKGQSGGETGWAGFITAMALRELAPKTNVLVLDEPGDGLDPAGARQLAVGIKKLAHRFETVFVVTHNTAMIDELDNDNSLTVYKKNQISYIK